MANGAAQWTSGMRRLPDRELRTHARGRSRPNPRMQPTGRRCPEVSSGAAYLEDAAERRIVRAVR